MRIRQVIARLAQLLIGKQRYRAWRIAILRRSEMNRQTGRVYEMRVSRYLPVTQPLILCSQIQRSGGTLLTDLLDGHPQCHTHPHELHIGCPDTATWPDLKLEDDADTWFTMLFEKRARDSFWMDYQRRIRKTDEPDRFPFMFWPDLQRAIFEQCVSSKPVRSVRDIFDCYMTAYFHAWLALGDIARELGVDALVEGTALRAGERFWITAQLIQVDPEHHLWADRYECAAADLLEAEARIARAVAESVRGALSPGDLSRLERPPRVDPDAHLE